jgi:hypothetical protein
MEDYSASVEHSLYLKPQCHPIKELKLLVLNVLTPTEAEMEGLLSFRRPLWIITDMKKRV